MLKKIGIISMGKYYGIYLGILGIILALLVPLVPNRETTLTLFLLPGLFALSGFITGLIDALIYNGLAVTVGGVRFDYSNNTIKNIDPLSLAKVYGIISALWGFVSASVLGFVFYAITGFIAAYLVALLYNFMAVKIGGVQLKLENGTLKKVDWLPVSKIIAVTLAMGAIAFTLLVGFIYLLFFGAISGSASILGTSLFVLIGGGLVGLVFALVFGFIFTAMEASFYNFLADNTKGLELYTE